MSAAAVAGVLASVTDVKHRNTLLWRGDGEYDSKVLLDVICFRSALSGPGNDGQRLGHLQSILHTDTGREEFARGMTAI